MTVSYTHLDVYKRQVLDRLDEDWIPVEKTWRLNEKHYGMLQGLNKSETTVQYGEEQVHIWRRSDDVAPAPVGKDDPRNPGMDIRYAGVPDRELPRTEALKDAIGRVMPYWECIIFPALMYKDRDVYKRQGSSRARQPVTQAGRSVGVHVIISHFLCFFL